MSTRRSVVVALSACVAAVPLSARAAEEIALDALEKASLLAVSWFKSLGAAMQGLVATEERSQLRRQLGALSKELYGIELAKLAFLEQLKRERLSDADIQATSRDLLNSVESTRAALRKTAPILRQQYAAGGEGVEKLLSQAVTGKAWLFDTHAITTSTADQRRDVIQQGERAVAALREANVQLALLIPKL